MALRFVYLTIQCYKSLLNLPGMESKKSPVDSLEIVSCRIGTQAAADPHSHLDRFIGVIRGGAHLQAAKLNLCKFIVAGKQIGQGEIVPQIGRASCRE